MEWPKTTTDGYDGARGKRNELVPIKIVVIYEYYADYFECIT